MCMYACMYIYIYYVHTSQLLCCVYCQRSSGRGQKITHLPKVPSAHGKGRQLPLASLLLKHNDVPAPPGCPFRHPSNTTMRASMEAPWRLQVTQANAFGLKCRQTAPRGESQGSLKKGIRQGSCELCSAAPARPSRNPNSGCGALLNLLPLLPLLHACSLATLRTRADGTETQQKSCQGCSGTRRRSLPGCSLRRPWATGVAISCYCCLFDSWSRGCAKR